MSTYTYIKEKAKEYFYTLKAWDDQYGVILDVVLVVLLVLNLVF